jgi:hypothetical protein
MVKLGTGDAQESKEAAEAKERLKREEEEKAKKEEERARTEREEKEKAAKLAQENAEADQKFAAATPAPVLSAQKRMCSSIVLFADVQLFSQKHHYQHHRELYIRFPPNPRS